MSQQRALAAGLVVLAGLLALVPSAGSAQTSTRALAARLTIDPDPPMRNERLTMTGSLPGGVRPFRVERRTAHGWVRVGHGSTVGRGFFTFVKEHASTAPRTYRVLARPHAGHPAVHTPTRTVRPVRESISLTVPSASDTGASLDATVRVTPARTGRWIDLQERRAGVWTNLDRWQATDLHPRTFPVVPGSAGILRLRAVAEKFRGAPEVVSSARTVVVSDPAPPAVGSLAAAPFRTGVSLTWTPSGPTYAGAVVRRVEGPTPPTSPTDGVAVPTTARDHVVDTGLTPGTTYAYAVFSHNSADPTRYGPAATTTTTTTTSGQWGPRILLPSAPGATPQSPVSWVSTSCPSASFCTTVNLDGSLSTYDGAEWAPATTAGNGGFTSVSCPTAEFCAAAGAGTLSTWNGSTWTGASVGTGRWLSVSCTSPAFCLAVDAEHDDAWTWDGTAWSAPTTFRPSSEVDPNNGDAGTLSCGSPSFCVTVGPKGAVHEYVDGVWQPTQTIAGGDPLFGVSCASASLCVATDPVQREASVWDGTNWSAPADLSAGGSTGDRIFAVSCTTAEACVVATESGRVWQWTGGTWVAESALVPVQSTASLSCPTTTFCAAGGFGDVALFR